MNTSDCLHRQINAYSFVIACLAPPSHLHGWTEDTQQQDPLKTLPSKGPTLELAYFQLRKMSPYRIYTYKIICLQFDASFVNRFFIERNGPDRTGTTYT